MAEEDSKNKKEEDLAEDFEFAASKGLFGDVVKKLFAAGTTAAFLTEERLKSYLGDIKLPKDVLNRILQGANKSKEEITGRVSKEIISIVKRIDFVKEASRFVEEHKFKISAEIEVSRKEPREPKDEKK